MLTQLSQLESVTYIMIWLSM